MAEPKLRKTTKSGGKAYVVKGERYASVTSIIDAGLPKPNLLTWYAEMAAKDAWEEIDSFGKMDRDSAIAWAAKAPIRNRDKAAMRGTKVHDYAEQMALGVPITIAAMETEEERAMARGFLKFWNAMKPEVVATECTVVSRKYKYAGTLDGIFRFGEDVGEAAAGELILCDYKGKPNQEKARWAYSNHVAQLNAYAAADFIALPDGTEESMPKVTGAAVIYIWPDGFTLIPCKVNAEGLRFFRYLAEVGKFTTSGYKEFLG